ncbi:MAG: putative integral membrane protein, partial [Gammaproteobacteria bacterium]
MSRLIKLCIFLLVLLLGLLFHLRNAQSVLVDYYLGVLELPFSATVVFVLTLGVVLGVLVSIPLQVRLKRENTRLRK